jgi:nucleoside-diphosphate-sugar epimerase
MGKNILVIGGTRYFGKLLVQRLLQAGHRVTIATRGQAPDPFGKRIERIRVDRGNETAMRAAFANNPGYDIVYDQMCYSPLDAAISTRVFSGKVDRYIMASTIDIYRPLLGSQDAPFAESAIDMLAQPIDVEYPWHDRSLANQSYVAGKLQAEAYFYRDGSLPVVTARIGHVLAGTEDFTARLAHYVELVRLGAPLRYSNAAAATSFISAPGITEFLAWTGEQEFTGPINAACDGGLSAFDIYQRVGMALDEQVKPLPASTPARPGALSPFDLPSQMLADTSHATALGYRFGHSDEWLETLIRQHDLSYA